jgi:hypothetical protein
MKRERAPAAGRIRTVRPCRRPSGALTRNPADFARDLPSDSDALSRRESGANALVIGLDGLSWTGS